jgi:glycine hydroxymethyltransferase
LDIQDTKEIESFAQRLEDANIIVDHGIRIGTCEATRRGMKTKDLERVAELIVRVYKGEDPAKVRREATKLRRQFNRILYT